MSARNKENDIGPWFIVMGTLFLITTAYALPITIIAALVGTVVSLLALRRPLRLGPVTIRPDGAQFYLARGIAGMLAAPLLMGVFGSFFGIRGGSELFVPVLLVGYSSFSLGYELAMPHWRYPAPHNAQR